MAKPAPSIERWTLSKPAAMSEHGIVVAQDWRAAEVGAEILAQGGNAVDAAVATALALGVVEPWMSGLGGAGLMLYGEGATGSISVVDFTLVSPANTDPKSYPVTAGTSSEIFGWPLVEGDRNVKGYASVCVPGSVDGLALALERFGTKSFAEVIEPAARLAEQGLPIDWHTSFAIMLAAADLNSFESSRAVFLPGGMPPAPDDHGLRYLPLPALARTYRRLQKAGPRDFYEGEIARSIVSDLTRGGSVLSARDLARYRATVVAPDARDYRGVRLHAAPGLTGGPTFLAAMEGLRDRLSSPTPTLPDANTYLSYAEVLRSAFASRFETLGHAISAPSNTTHLSVVDRDGNMVALTNTLLSRFGSKVVLPQSGIVMNNGMMWFDPTPGRPNSIAPGKKPLANMCPVLLAAHGRPWVALGACGGRRIIPAVTQLVSFLIDFGMSLEQAFDTPRIDASTSTILYDLRLDTKIAASLARHCPIQGAENGTFPLRFAMPSAVMRDHATGRNTGMTHIASPVAAAIAERAPC